MTAELMDRPNERFNLVSARMKKTANNWNRTISSRDGGRSNAGRFANSIETLKNEIDLATM